MNTTANSHTYSLSKVKNICEKVTVTLQTEDKNVSKLKHKNILLNHNYKKLTIRTTNTCTTAKTGLNINSNQTNKTKREHTTMHQNLQHNALKTQITQSAFQPDV
jgi:hypothetical protein